MSTLSAKFHSLFSLAGIDATTVVVLGTYVHVDTAAENSDRLRGVMQAAGFRPLFARDGEHLDGSRGFRMAFKLDN